MLNPAAAALVQTRFETIDPELLEQVLSQLTQLPRAEIIRLARRQRGILYENLPPSTAAEVVRHLTALNVGVASVPASSLPELSKPRSALWIEPDETGFGVPLDHRQILERIDWHSVFAIHAELLPDPQAKADKATAAAQQRAAAQPGSTTKLSRRFPNVDLVCISAAGKFVHFRIAQSRFAPGRMPWIAAEQSLADKFYQLLQMLIDRSTAAIISPAARRLSVERPASTHTLAELWTEDKDERAMTGYLRWLVWLAMRREQQLAR